MRHCKRNCSGFSAALLCGLLFAATAVHAGHPLVTDDAGTVGKGGVQIEINGELAFDRERADDGTTEKGEATEAALAVTYGLTESLDIVVTAPYRWLSTHQDDALTARENGLADMSLDLKWRFLERDGWGMAIKPGITLPTGNADRGLGSGRTTYRLFLVTTREIAPWALHLNLGYIRNENNGGDRTDLWHASLAGEVELVKELKAVVNVGAETNPTAGSGTHPAFALGGLVYGLSEKISLDAGVKFGLTKPEADVTWLAGVTVKF